MIKRRGRERGGFLINMGLILALAIPNAMLATKVIPPTLDHMTAENALQKLKESGQVYRNVADVRAAMSKFFRVEGLNSIQLSEVQAERKGDILYVDLSYERRISFWRNIDLVVKFSTQEEVAAR
ncbi:MAG: DUF4845 domain-containing protein [Gammaproteobacteria bacterium]|nr:DUF4845 domain-containing protein [Gammaproteobacteria bacterium]